MEKGTSYARITRSLSILAFTWSLIAIVIVNAYNSSVISYLSVNYKKPEVSTFRDLANNNQYQLLTAKGTIMEHDIKVHLHANEYFVLISEKIFSLNRIHPILYHEIINRMEYLKL